MRLRKCPSFYKIWKIYTYLVYRIFVFQLGYADTNDFLSMDHLPMLKVEDFVRFLSMSSFLSIVPDSFISNTPFAIDLELDSPISANTRGWLHLLCVLVSPLRNHCGQGEAREHCCSTWLSHLFDITWMVLPSTLTLTSWPATVSFGTGMAPRKSMVHFFITFLDASSSPSGSYRAPNCTFLQFMNFTKEYVQVHIRTRHYLISICFHSARAHWNNNYTVTLSGFWLDSKVKKDDGLPTILSDIEPRLWPLNMSLFVNLLLERN